MWHMSLSKTHAMTAHNLLCASSAAPFCQEQTLESALRCHESKWHLPTGTLLMEALAATMHLQSKITSNVDSTNIDKFPTFTEIIGFVLLSTILKGSNLMSWSDQDETTVRYLQTRSSQMDDGSIPKPKIKTDNSSSSSPQAS
eukprot:3200883-Amphidinium_carterae.1